MRRTLAIAVLLAASLAAAPADWAGNLSPIAASDWIYDRAAHLLERAGFATTILAWHGRNDAGTILKGRLEPLRVFE